MKNFRLCVVQNQFTNNEKEVVVYDQFYLGVKTELKTIALIPIKVTSRDSLHKHTLTSEAVRFSTFKEAFEYVTTELSK